jgi:hypothetical protein
MNLGPVYHLENSAEIADLVPIRTSIRNSESLFTFTAAQGTLSIAQDNGIESGLQDQSK